jgi:phosphatidate cytidylyltransferase
MHGKRWLVALVGIPVMFSIIQYGPPSWFFLFVTALVVIGLFEYYRMFLNSGYHPQALFGIAIGVLVISGVHYGSDLDGIAGLVFSPGVMVAAAFLGSLVCRLFSYRDTNGAMVDVALTFTGVIYVAWLSSYIVLVRDWNVGGLDGRELTYFLLLVTWATDSGAFYAGTYFGKHKLYPKISPKKSVEGAIGGIGLAMAMALFCRYLFLDELTLHDTVALALIIGVVGQVGDLAESMIKRSTRVKDSGGLIPGHGGVLDRLDSILFNAPAMYYYAYVMTLNL